MSRNVPWAFELHYRRISYQSHGNKSINWTHTWYNKSFYQISFVVRKSNSILIAWCHICGSSDINIPQRVWAKPVVGHRTELFAFPCDVAPIRSRGTPMKEIRSSLTIRLVITKFCLVFGAFHWIMLTWDLFPYNKFSQKYAKISNLLYIS